MKKKNKYANKSRVCLLCQKTKNLCHFNLMDAEGNRRSECRTCTGVEAIDWAAAMKHKYEAERRAKRKVNKRVRNDYLKEWRDNAPTLNRKQAMADAVPKLMANLPLEELTFV
jgi:hypothetical protein